jgi:hypothetical protein
MQPGIASAEGAPCIDPTLAGMPLPFGGIMDAVLPEDFEDIRHEFVSERQTTAAI